VKTPKAIFTFSLALFLLLTLFTGCNRGPSDETLTQNVQAKLKSDASLATAPISVSTKDGAVTLSGEVNSAVSKNRAEELAKSVEGVKTVTNNLTVKTPPPVIAQDDPLKTQVMANLTKYGVTGVSVSVANGEVTLTGQIPRAKLQDVMKAANEAHPKKVNNKLTIK
jgi:osmotically-inducible protein OsmY